MISVIHHYTFTDDQLLIFVLKSNKESSYKEKIIMNDEGICSERLTGCNHQIVSLLTLKPRS